MKASRPRYPGPAMRAAPGIGCDDGARDEILFQSAGLEVGAFRCPPGDPRWRQENRIERGHHLVLPGTSVRITQAGRRPIVANPNHTILYNDGQIYRRGLISEQGDRCVFLIVAPELIADALSDVAPAAADRADAPFPFDHGPCDAKAYLLHRQVVRALSRGAPADPLWIEEALVRLVQALLEQAFRAADVQARPARARTQAAHALAAEAAKEVLSRRFQEPLRLSELAREVGLSVFHLARVFKQRTGLSVYAYRNQLRLLLSLERLLGAGMPREADLTGLALDLGFSSHSHFTDAFRRAFGLPPSAIRGASAAQVIGLREPSKRMEA